ncbi:ATP-binding protein [Aurantimonas sp. LRZ36]|uniref:ATP-binding protein n=2 Tax=Aurantimonas marianensis TaxID=2920428 RepID=A0A9X2HCX3_9HYPH|nr:ATP-binding protein [Aurantimonas marianensis]
MKAMTSIGASAIKRTKFVTAVSEIARNAIIYGGGGVISFATVGNGSFRHVVATCSDRGPGIDDIKQALTDGFTTGNGLGLGLSGARRPLDRLEVESSRESGTTVIMECAAR